MVHLRCAGGGPLIGKSGRVARAVRGIVPQNGGLSGERGWGIGADVAPASQPAVLQLEGLMWTGHCVCVREGSVTLARAMGVAPVCVCVCGCNASLHAQQPHWG